MVKEIAGYIVAPMWREFMLVALAKYPKEFFNEPPAIPDSVQPALRGVFPGNGLPVHSLLYWTNKENPLGGVPSNPASDPQFGHWEYPILSGYSASGVLVPVMEASTTPEQ